MSISTRDTIPPKNSSRKNKEDWEDFKINVESAFIDLVIYTKAKNTG